MDQIYAVLPFVEKLLKISFCWHCLFWDIVWFRRFSLWIKQWSVKDTVLLVGDVCCPLFSNNNQDSFKAPHSRVIEAIHLHEVVHNYWIHTRFQVGHQVFC